MILLGGSFSPASPLFINTAYSQTATSATSESAASSQAEAGVGFLLGTWKGTYICGQGETGVEVSVTATNSDAKLRGMFRFYSLPGRGNAMPGEFGFVGRFDKNISSINTKPISWIRQPPGYTAVGFTGEISSTQREFVGRIDNPGCGAITLSKVGSNIQAGHLAPSYDLFQAHNAMNVGNVDVAWWFLGDAADQGDPNALAMIGTLHDKEQVAQRDPAPPAKLPPAQSAVVSDQTITGTWTGVLACGAAVRDGPVSIDINRPQTRGLQLGTMLPDRGDTLLGHVVFTGGANAGNGYFVSGHEQANGTVTFRLTGFVSGGNAGFTLQPDGAGKLNGQLMNPACQAFTLARNETAPRAPAVAQAQPGSPSPPSTSPQPPALPGNFLETLWGAFREYDDRMEAMKARCYELNGVWDEMSEECWKKR